MLIKSSSAQSTHQNSVDTKKTPHKHQESAGFHHFAARVPLIKQSLDCHRTTFSVNQKCQTVNTEQSEWQSSMKTTKSYFQSKKDSNITRTNKVSIFRIWKKRMIWCWKKSIRGSFIEGLRLDMEIRLILLIKAVLESENISYRQFGIGIE